MVTLTKTGVEFVEYHVYRETTSELVGDEYQDVTRWYIAVGYRVTTAEGETWVQKVAEEIKGDIKTKAVSLGADIQAIILQREGL